ncbi:hypothetical protein U9M48_000160 [Paspalum notatum var. saurae]|uniref:DNA sliding clamp PCNA n=1 Tax=Paspalum notatum var. saurae TaxID=547442 RepID=A0AAQ3PHS7_PASNO
MLELPLVKGDPFHHVLEAILDLSDVAHVVCTRRGLNLQAVDTKRAAIVSLLFPAEDFKGYTCDEYISMGIPIRDLVKAIRCGDKDTITLKVGEENITISFVSPEKSTVDYEFRLVDAELARFELPDWQDLESKYQASVKMPSVEFRRICKYLSNFGEEDGVISVTDEDLTFFAKGTNGDVYMYKQPEEDTTTFKIDMQEPITLTLDLKYLNTFAKVFTLSDQVKLCLSKTHLMVECKIGQKGHIRCFLAPKVETEFQGEEEEKETQEDINANKEKAPKMETELQGEEEKDTQKEGRCQCKQEKEEKETRKETKVLFEMESIKLMTSGGQPKTSLVSMEVCVVRVCL